MEGKELARAAAKALSDKKGKDIVLVNVAEQTVVCSYFVIASGSSSTQVHALCDNVEEALKKLGITPIRTEGVREGRWGCSTTAMSSCMSSTRNPASSTTSSGSGTAAKMSKNTKKCEFL